MPNYTQKDKATKGNMAAQQGGNIKGRAKVNSMKQTALRNASKNRSSSVEPKTTNVEPKTTKPKKTTVLAETGGGDKFNTGFEMKRIESNPVSTARPMANEGFNDLELAKSPDSFQYAALMKAKAMTSDEMALAPSRQVMQDRKNIDFDSSTDRGIASLYTGKRQEEHHTSGMPDFITSAKSGKRINTMNIDEGNFSKITTNIPERSKVTATEDSDKYQKGEEFYVDPAKMQAKHPSMKRMEEMVSKVATYNMPNAKAAQKKYYK